MRRVKAMRQVPPNLRTLVQRVNRLSRELATIALEVEALIDLVEATGKSADKSHELTVASLDEAIAMQKAIIAAGGYRALARALRISHQAIRRWPRCPAHQVVAVEKATGVGREQLRPSLYR